MGYLIYVMWIASLVSSLGGIGVPETTRKYMAELLGMNDRGTARYIYIRTLLLQMVWRLWQPAASSSGCSRYGKPEYRIASLLVALSIWPGMVNYISAQANVATENLSTNLPASVISLPLFFLLTMVATVVLKWGIMWRWRRHVQYAVVDFLVRLFPTITRILLDGRKHTRSHPVCRRA
jgi:hypothetical protein